MAEAGAGGIAAAAGREPPVFSSEKRGRKGRVAVRSAGIGVGVLVFIWLAAMALGTLGFGGLPGLELPGTGHHSNQPPNGPIGQGSGAVLGHSLFAGSAAFIGTVQQGGSGRLSNSGGALPGTGGGKPPTGTPGTGGSGGTTPPGTGGTGSTPSGNGRGKPAIKPAGGRGAPAVTPNGKHTPGNSNGKGNGHLK